ncbi:MAG: hypothetical protein JWQ62_2479 [Lacunisphaera sp.]|nr:hypothetical protein [Lacunisphaera sp.]
MSSWEYKLISSGPLGFASMPLLEQHLAQLGKDEWEIINFTTKPDNPLVFHGLARRPIARDWFPPADTKPAYTPPAIPAEPEDDGKDERSFADELPPVRPANAPAPADLGLGDFDDLAGSEEDLPTLFEALQPFLRKNPRGDLSVELDFLAKKFEQDPREVLTAFEECGLQLPPQGEEKGDVVDHDGSLYWLERDKKGRVWVNTRDKRFKTVKTTAVPAEPRTERAPEVEAPRREARPPQPERAARPIEHVFSDGDSFLTRIRSMMRRNRRGHGWSGSFQYLTKALKMDDAQLLEKLGEFGLRLAGGDKPVLAYDGDFEFYLNRNQRGEIWINAEEKQGGGQKPEDRGPVATQAAESQSGRNYEDPREAFVPAKAPLPPENTLTAVRLLMEPKKRGEGVTALVKDLAEKLEKSEEQMLAALASAGLHLPESPKAKPTFAEHGGEIYWLNVNAKGQVWLNAKASKKAKAKK